MTNTEQVLAIMPDRSRFETCRMRNAAYDPASDGPHAYAYVIVVGRGPERPGPSSALWNYTFGVRQNGDVFDAGSFIPDPGDPALIERACGALLGSPEWVQWLNKVAR